MSDAALWAAPADPHRRAVVALLLERPRPVGEKERYAAHVTAGVPSGAPVPGLDA